MRTLALIFGLIGAAGSGVLGAKWLGDAKDSKGKIDFVKQVNDAIQDPETTKKLKDLDRLILTAYVLIGGAAVGLVGVGVMLLGHGKLAALLFLIGFGGPLVTYKEGAVAIFTFGLALAAVFAFIAPPKLAHSRVRQAEARGE